MFLARNERGVATVTVVLIAPALLVVLMLIVQVGLVAHARSVAAAAAADGAEQARLLHGTTRAARAETRATLDHLAGGMLTDRQVVVSRSATTASVTVTGQLVTMVPGLTWTVSETAAGPVERAGALP